jgi:hypothetical protein
VKRSAQSQHRMRNWKTDHVRKTEYHEPRMLPVPVGKTHNELIRNDPSLTPEQKKDHEAALKACAFSEFAVMATRAKYKKSGSSILVGIAVQDLKQKADYLRQKGVDGKTHPAFQHLGIIEKAAATGDVGFFKSLGRALEKNNSGAWGWDDLGYAMLRLMWQKPAISDKDAERELIKQGFGQATAENFNKFYNGVRASLHPERQHQFPKRKPGRKSQVRRKKLTEGSLRA